MTSLSVLVAPCLSAASYTVFCKMFFLNPKVRRKAFTSFQMLRIQVNSTLAHQETLIGESESMKRLERRIVLMIRS